MKLETKAYKKLNSFLKLQIKNQKDEIKFSDNLRLFLNEKENLTTLKAHQMHVIDFVKKDLFGQGNKGRPKFTLTKNVIEEMCMLEQTQIPLYLFHRYRYEIYPQMNLIDDFPPCLQIEPTSICNYRCVFCFETDETFTNKKSGYMGMINFDLFKKAIDDAEGNIEFVTLASRGEPLACNEIERMLKYTTDKFLNLKLNTNASLLNEKKCHAILSGGVKTIVFSADAATEPLYSQLRVNGNLNKVLKNIEMFKKIREIHYPGKKIISRVSGVKCNDSQDFNSMQKIWGELVDQVAFVKYNPWENNYKKDSNNIATPCSDLWRRMFIWWDGKCNPCDVDYKSKLSTGVFPEKSLYNLWQSKSYMQLRENHINKNRKKVVPCKSCQVV